MKFFRYGTHAGNPNGRLSAAGERVVRVLGWLYDHTWPHHDQWTELRGLQDDDGEDIADIFDDDPDDRCIHCGADVGHYNGCIEDPGAMCLCHLCMGDEAVTSEVDCPYHGGGDQDVPRSGAPAQRGVMPEAGNVSDPGAGYFHDDAPTVVVPAVQLGDGSYAGLKGTTTTHVPRPGREVTTGCAGNARSRPEDRAGPGYLPHAGPPRWRRWPMPAPSSWVDDLVQRVMDAPLHVVRTATASGNPELALWNWSQQKALAA